LKKQKDMSKRQIMFSVLLASVFGGIIALGGYKLFEKEQPTYFESQNRNVQFSNYINDTSYVVPEGLNFVYAAELVTPTVVHIKSTSSATASRNPQDSPFGDFFRDYFGDPRQYRNRPQQSAGSGVIISNNGFIVTNNHVVANAENLEVTLNDNRTFEAELIGTDPSTDIAVIKIDARGLPFVNYGNSDNVRVGEWVLAVGNPFDLTSTVTAGIVSAKGRNIGIMRERYGIESFIQTDAAVNPGNSGGALVDLKGRLIGINTAIATPTGSYAGYSFAVPVSLVSKVVDDLIEYGVVQRAVLGIEIVDANDPRLEEDVDEVSGVYVNKVNENSAASEAGLQKGDVITKINDTDVTNVAELQDLVARHRPGDKIDVTFKREGKSKTVSAKLKNLDNEIRIVRKDDSYRIEGASLRNASEDEASNYDVDGGVIIEDIDAGKWKDAGIEEGFLITSVNNRPISNVNDLRSMLRASAGEGVLIKGKYPDGKEAYYGMGW
jgi:Do/DeqQ family serine protease